MRKPPNDRALDSRKPFASSEVEKRVSTGDRRSAVPPEPAEGLDTNGAGAAATYRPGHVPERTCILTRTHGTRDSLIRLALGPDGQVLPDVRAKAPGRGAWIGVDRKTLEAAQAKGKLKGALSRAFKTGELAIPDDLAERIETALRQAALDRLGLEARSGTLLTGSEKIAAAARAGKVALLLHAADAGGDGNGRLDQAWRVGSEGEHAQGLVLPAQRSILSLALGRENVVHIALIDRAAAARVSHAIDRWRAFIGPDAGLSAAVAASPVVSAVD